jgi:cytochrome d ubiquinol oxidase subunit I
VAAGRTAAGGSGVLVFRIMVGMGMLMIATGVMALVLFWRKRLFDTRWFHLWCMA